MSKQLIISIGREYGSTGHNVAKRLAEDLKIAYYDRNLLDIIAQNKNSDAETLAQFDEAPHNSFLSRRVRGFSNSPAENVAELQFELLKQKAADEDSFVIVGRCSDEIFKGLAPVLRVFFTASMEDRIKCVMESRGFDEKKAEKTIIRHDKTRKAYHDHFCQSEWGKASTYDLCLNISTLGEEQCFNIIKEQALKMMAD